MANTTSYAQIFGTFRDSWLNKFLEPFKTVTPLLEAAQFREGKEQGGVIHWPMRGTIESGTTFAAPRTTPGEGTLPYIGARSGQAPDWQVEAPQIHGRSKVTYEAFARSMESVDAKSPDMKKAVRDASRIVMEGLMGGTVKKAEALMLHGRRGVATAVATSDVVAASTVAGNELANPWDGNVAGFVVDLQIDPQRWAEAIFVQCEGGTFDVWSNVAGVPTAKLNTATNTVLNGANQTGYILLAINPPTPQSPLAASATRVLRFFHSTGTAGGTGVGILGGAAVASLATAFVFYESGSPTTEYVSLTAMARNRGTLFGVSGVQYSVAQGNFVQHSGALKLADLIRYHSRPINKGAMGKGFTAVVPTELFAQFANDESTLRRYQAVTGTAENGFDTIQMYLPHKGKLEILGHALQVDGEVLSYCQDEVIRIGAQDFDFVRRGSNANTWILETAQSPSSEARIYAQFAPLCETPSHMLSVAGFTY